MRNGVFGALLGLALVTAGAAADDASLRALADARGRLIGSAVDTGYVAQALAPARAADPGARLYINDYNTEAIGPKSNAMYALVQDLQARQVPLDGVGFQAHLSTQYAFPSTLTANLQRFADLGLDVAVTEADIRVPLPATDTQLQSQADYFGQLVRSCLAVERCVSLTVWGFTDAHSWAPGVFRGQGAATPPTADLQPKPAYFALRDSLLDFQRRDTPGI
jgi:endo-1,4-beta-xylanase